MRAVNPNQDIQQETPPAAPGSAAEPPAPAPRSLPEKTEKPRTANDEQVDLGNLAIGAGLLLSAFLVFWMAQYLPNGVAIRTLVASFGTFALVWVLHRTRVFQRQHGGVIATGAVALFAASLPFIERGFLSLDRAAKAGLAGESAKPESEPEPAGTLPVPTRQNAPAAPSPAVPPPPAEDDTVHEMVAREPDASVRKIIVVTQDAKLSINGKKFLIKAGSKFPFTKLEDGIVTFVANGQEATIDVDLVKITGSSQETPEAIEKMAQIELMRRYPAIGVKDSPENELFVGRIKELRLEMPALFKNPKWPLEIGEQLAAQEGWRSADAPADDASTAPIPPAAPTTPMPAPAGAGNNPDLPPQAAPLDAPIAPEPPGPPGPPPPPRPGAGPGPGDPLPPIPRAGPPPIPPGKPIPPGGIPTLPSPPR